MSKNVYFDLAQAVHDFSLHRINKLELYEIVANCILQCTNEDKEQVVSGKELIRNNYTVAKDWLYKK